MKHNPDLDTSFSKCATASCGEVVFTDNVGDPPEWRHLRNGDRECVAARPRATPTEGLELLHVASNRAQLDALAGVYRRLLTGSEPGAVELMDRVLEAIGRGVSVPSGE